MVALAGEFCALADPVNTVIAIPTLATTSAVLFMETSLLCIPGNACGAPEVFIVRRGSIAASGSWRIG
jgi:hypothetical protein